MSKLKKYDTKSKEQKKLLKDLVKGLGKKSFDPTQSPEYQSSLDQIRGVSQYAQDLMSPNSQTYETMKAPVMQQYQEEVVPEIMEHFGGMGMGSSSAMNLSLAKSGQSLEERLGALRSGLQGSGTEMQSGLAKQMYGIGMTPYEYAMQQAQTLLGTNTFGYYQPGQKVNAQGQSGGGGGNTGLGAGAGAAIGSIWGPAGATIGSGLGNWVESWFH